jgi:hypothetical protein
MAAHALRLLSVLGGRSRRSERRGYLRYCSGLLRIVHTLLGLRPPLFRLFCFPVVDHLDLDMKDIDVFNMVNQLSKD